MADSKPMTTPNAALVAQITALLEFSASGNAVPKLPGAAKTLLERAATALQSDAAQARVEALEEAAKVADHNAETIIQDVDDCLRPPHEIERAEIATARVIASNIRALKEPTQ